jgi:hypothetical protein
MGNITGAIFLAIHTVITPMKPASLKALFSRNAS